MATVKDCQSLSVKTGLHGATDSNERRIVLVGKTGVGKSAAGNTILGTETFESELSPSSLTSECQKAKEDVGGREVAVIDTPGLFDTNFTKEEVLKRIKMCISLSAPGPHAFLVVLQLGRFTQEEKDTIKMIQETFGEDADKYTMVLFTHGDRLKQAIEDFISRSPDLKAIIEKCYNRYHVFNNENKDPDQTSQLLAKIDKMVMDNGGSYYTNQMFMKAEAAIEKEKQRLLKESEAKKQKELDELKAKFEEEANRREKERVRVRDEREARDRAEMEAKRQRELDELKAKSEEEAYRREKERVRMRDEREARDRAEMEAKKQRELDELKAKSEEETYRREKEQVCMRYEREARDRAERSNYFITGTVMATTAVGAAVGAVVGSVAGPAGAAVGAVVGAAAGAAVGLVAGAEAGDMRCQHALRGVADVMKSECDKVRKRDFWNITNSP